MRKLFKVKNLAAVALFGLVLLPALGAFQAQAQTAPRGVTSVQGRVLSEKYGDYTAYTDAEIQWTNGVDKNFFRSYPGEQIDFTASLKLVSPKILHVASKLGSGDAVKVQGGQPLTIFGLAMGAVVTSQRANLCPPSGGTCQFNLVSKDSFVSDGSIITGIFGSGFDIVGGVDGKFRFTIPSSGPGSLAFADGKEEGYVIQLDVIPVLKVKAGDVTKVNDVPFFGVAKSIYIQMYKTKAARDAAVQRGDPLPPGVPNNNESTTGGGAQDNTAKDPSLIGQFIGGIVRLFSSVLKIIIFKAVGPLIEVVLSIHTYDDKFAQVIYPAWEIFRNLGNIFFILAIVAIGVATVFRISGWAVKDLLVKLIIAAILINFSLAIAQSILGVADTVQNQFLPNDTGAIRALANHIFTTDNIFKTSSGYQAGQGGVVEDIVGFFLNFAAFIAFIGVLALLVVRLLFLWILLMLSPLPYIAMVLPISRSSSKKWWSEFGRWAFITPVVAFMLNLTALITQKTRDNNIIQSLSTSTAPNDGAVSGIMFNLASNAIPLAFMYMTLKAATAFGKGSAGFVDKALDKGAKAAFWPAAAAGAAIGGGALAAGKYAGGLAAGVGKVPINLARLKLAESSQARAERLAGTSDQKATFADKAKSLIFDSGKILEAKNKRLEEWRKDAQGYRAEALSHVERNIVSLDGRKVRKARTALANSNLDENAINEQMKLLKQDQREELLNQLKKSGVVASDMTLNSDGLVKTLTEKKRELGKELNEKKTKLATKDIKSFYDSLYDDENGVFKQQGLALGKARALAESKGDSKKVAEIQAQQMALDDAKLKMEYSLKHRDEKGLDLSAGALAAMTKGLTSEQQSAMKAEFESLRTRSVDPKELSDIESEYNAIDPLLQSNKYIADRRRTLGKDEAKFTDDELVADGKKQAQEDLDKLADLKAKSKYMAFYGQEKVRRDFTDAQSAKLPKEYDEGNNINQFKSAIARGDKYLALKTWELAEKEGDIKKLLKAMEYNDDKKGLEDFMNDHFGAGGFKMDAQTMTDLKRESSKRNKAAGNLDLSEQVRFDATAGKYVDNTPDEDVGAVKGRLNTVLDKMTGDSTLQRSLNKLNTGMVFTWDAEKQAYDVNKMFETVLKGIDLKDATALKAIADTLPAVVKKQLVSKTNNILKTDADVARAKEQLVAVAKAQGLKQDQIDDFYLMLQQSVQNVPASDRIKAQEAYKRISRQSQIDQGRVYDRGAGTAGGAGAAGGGGTTP